MSSFVREAETPSPSSQETDSPHGHRPFSDAELAELVKAINPETADVEWWYTQVLDPYRMLDLPDECLCVGRGYFARPLRG